MMKGLIKPCLIALCFAVAASPAFCQEMIHAVSGTVTAIHPKIGMIEIATDDGSSGHFNCAKTSGVSYDFDKSVKADATEAGKFTGTGAHVIVFYFGDGDVRTAVALQLLTGAPIKTITGTVVKFNRHQHLLTIKNSAGDEESFSMNSKTVTDTMTGVADDFKYDFDKGQSVQVTASAAKGIEAALLIAPAV
jgi:hypothetical protein